MHTVFGPAVENLRQQNVIFTRTPASGELAREFEAIFYKYGAKITYTTPEYHDKQMASASESGTFYQDCSGAYITGRTLVTRQSWILIALPTPAPH